MRNADAALRVRRVSVEWRRAPDRRSLAAARAVRARGEGGRAPAAPRVGLGAECKKGVGAEPHLAADPRREVHAEEREAGIGDRVDEAAHQAGTVRREAVVVATEGDDPYGIGSADLPRDPV